MIGKENYVEGVKQLMIEVIADGLRPLLSFSRADFIWLFAVHMGKR